MTSAIADQLFEYLKEQHPMTNQFGLMHIRRNDARASCETSLQIIASYLSCGLEGADAYGNSTVLMASDESDPCYRKAIIDIGRQLGFTILDLDAVVLHYLTDHVVSKDPANLDRFVNNMFLFGIIYSMYWDYRMKFHFIQRRKECESCGDLREKLSWTVPQVVNSRGEAPPQMDFEKVNQTYHECLATI
jgi:hypothetical protein